MNLNPDLAKKVQTVPLKLFRALDSNHVIKRVVPPWQQVPPSLMLLVFQVRINLALPIKLVIIPRSRILESYTILQHMVNSDQYGMRLSNISPFASPSGTDSLKLCVEKGFFVLYCRVSTDDKC